VHRTLRAGVFVLVTLIASLLVAVNASYAAPVTTATPPGGLYNADQSVTLSTDIPAAIFFTTDGTMPTLDSPVFDGTPLDITTTTTLMFFAVDGGDNAEAVQTQVYTIDKVVPVGSVTINNGDSFVERTAVTLTLTCSDASGCTKMMISNDESFTGAVEISYAVYEGWAVSPGDGSKTVHVRYKDAAGNWSATCLSTIELDSTKPYAEYIHLNRFTVGKDSLAGCVYDKSANLIWARDGNLPGARNWYDAQAWVAALNQSGGLCGYTDWRVPNIDELQALADRQPASAPSLLDSLGFTNTILSKYWSSSQYQDYINLGLWVDFGPNHGDTDGDGPSYYGWKSDPRYVRSVRSGVYGFHGNLGIKVSSGEGATSTNAVQLYLAAFHANGVESMRFSDNGTDWSDPEPYATTRSYDLPAGDGTKTVSVMFKAVGGNWSRVYSDSIVLDTTPPTTTPTPGPGFSTMTSVSLATGEAGTTIYYTTDGTDPTEDSTVYSTPISILATTTLKFFAVDSVGNPETFQTALYTIDMALPSGTVRINGTDAITNSPAVALTLTCTDTGSGCADMKFRNESGGVWSSYEPFAATKAWTMAAGDGVKTVYAKYRDGVGNESVSASDTIVLDTTPPDAPVVSGTSPTNQDPPTWTWTSGGNGGSGNFRYRLDNGDLTVGATETTALAFVPGSSVTEATHVLFVQERDAVGNWSLSGSCPVVVDLTPPTATISGTPATPTRSTGATLTIGGAQVVAYKYKLDGGSFSAETPVATPITLAGLSEAGHTVAVAGRDAAGNWQLENDASTTTWTVIPTIELTIVATDPNASEAGVATGEFTVTRTGSTAAPLAVSYTASGTATAGGDYAALSGVATIAAGASAATIVVTPVNDLLVEADETVAVTLLDDAAYTLGTPSSATVTIVSDDILLPTVTVTATDSTASEVGPTTGQFLVARAGETTAALAVHYTLSGSATPESDHAALPGVVTIGAGAGTATITVTPVDDAVVEADETVTLTIHADDGYTIGTPASATVTIVSDDAVVDTVAPAVAITYPGNNAMLDEIYAIEGTASDDAPSSGIARVEIRVYNGSRYLKYDANTFQHLWVTGEEWLAASGTAAWHYDLPIGAFVSGKQYTVTARAVDGNGNSSTATTSFYFNTGTPLYTILSGMLSSNTIRQTDTIDVSGSLSEMSPEVINLIDLPLTLTVTPPSGPPVTYVTTTASVSGAYTFRDVGGFALKGSYSLRAQFAGNALLQPASSEPQTLLVGSSAGYAVIIEGRLPDDAAGLASHNKTTNRVYQHFVGRGFDPANVFYYNFASGQPGVDGIPVKADVQHAIEVLVRDRMNGVPAPLWLVMVDHGSPGKFHLGSDWVSPTELNAWLGNLENGRPAVDGQPAAPGLNEQGKLEKRIVVIGSCYSGSFIDLLRQAPEAGVNGGRVVITSAAASEESYKGPQEPDEIRSGEFFIEELFKNLDAGASVREAFVKATQDTESYTSQGSGSANNANDFGDHAAQHPLLEDDGVGGGSNALSDGEGDGVAAAILYLGVGLTNSASNPADLVHVTPTLYLDASTEQAQLWAEPDAYGDVDTCWVEVKAPTKVLSGQGGSSQLELDVPRVFLDPNDLQQRREFTYGTDCEHKGCFIDPGRYDIYYFTRNKYTGQISAMLRSAVYKDKAGNQPPGAFSPVSPVDGAEGKTVVMLDWADSLDPDGDAVSYAVEISLDPTFAEVDYLQEEIPQSALAIDREAGLKDLSQYYWRVAAVDVFGARTPGSAIWSFTTNNTNPELPGYVKGCVRDAVSGAAAAAPAIGASRGSLLVFPDGCYSVYADSGEVSITAAATGYKSASITATVPAGTAATRNIALEPLQFSLTLQTAGAGAGTVSGAGSYPYKKRVTVSASPAEDSLFSGWSGACSGASLSTAVTLDAHKTCTATFRLKPVLSVTRSGNGSGTVTSDPVGLACGSSCAKWFNPGTPVALSATHPGSVFVGWGAPCEGSGACSVTMEDGHDVTVHAVFMAATQVLTVTRTGNGQGVVTADRSGLTWDGDVGAGGFDYDSAVTLTAAPAAGSVFVGWNGACSGSESSCTVTLRAAVNVTAEFSLTIQELRVTLRGGGSGEVVPEQGALDWTGNEGIGHYTYGSQVHLQARPDVGSVFGGWSGACGAGAECAVGMYGSRDVTAIFAPAGGSVVAVDRHVLLVDGNPFTVKGVVYQPVPVGQDPAEPPYGDYFTAAAAAGRYEQDLAAIRRMHANTVSVWMTDGGADHRDFLNRAYNGGVDPLRVIAGFRIQTGQDIDPVSGAAVRAQIVADFRALVAGNKDHPAILLWAIGDGLNSPGVYGADAASLANLFSLIEEMAAAAHAEDPNHPVTTPLADVDLVATIAVHEPQVPSLDLWGATVYRGTGFGSLFDDYATASAKPLLVLGFGVDAYDNNAGAVDAATQSDSAAALWGEIEFNSDVCFGGTVMEYQDEWWKDRLSSDAACAGTAGTHDTCGQTNTAFPDEYDNFEWWGIMAVPPGAAPETPTERAVYGRLQELFWSAGNALMINGGARYTGDRSVALGIAPKPGTTEMCIGNAADPCVDWETVAGVVPSWLLEDGADGERTVNAWFKDAAGGVTTAAASDSIVLDTTAPADGTLGGTPGVSRITLDWNGYADDGGSGLRGYTLVSGTGGAPASCDAGTALYHGPATSYVHTGLTNETYSYRVCATDRVGNRSDGAVWSGKPLGETQAPAGTVRINAGAAATNRRAATLDLTALDASGPVQMCVSNVKSCSAWTAFAERKSWTLTSGDGKKSVNVWFKDAWGNRTPLATPYAATILLDTVAPRNGTVRATRGSGQITLTWKYFRDPLSRIRGYKVVYAAGSAPRSCAKGTPVPGYDGSSTSYVHTGLLTKTYGYRVCAVDNAGNTSSGVAVAAKPLAGQAGQGD